MTICNHAYVATYIRALHEVLTYAQFLGKCQGGKVTYYGTPVVHAAILEKQP